MGDIVCTTSNKYFVNNCYGGNPVLGDHNSPKKTKITKRKLRGLYKFDGKAFNTKIGFITNGINNHKSEMFDLVLGEKQHYEAINPYVNSFKFRGFDISFNEEDFNIHPNSYKKKFLELIRKYSNGKYLLEYNDLTKEIEIINK